MSQAGLSDAEIEAAAGAAKERKLEGKWVLPLQNTTQQPPLKELTDRGTREALFKAGWNRTEKGDANDTRATIDGRLLIVWTARVADDGSFEPLEVQPAGGKRMHYDAYRRGLR